MAGDVRVRVEFSFDGDVDEDLRSWLITTLVPIGAHDIEVSRVDREEGS